MSAPGGAGQGRLVAICAGPGGIPKHTLSHVRVRRGGLDGDDHRWHGHGGPDRAVCLLSQEEVKSLEGDGVVVSGPGAFGENLLVAGLDFTALRPGDRLSLSPAAGTQPPVVLELTDVRAPCKTLTSVDPRFPDLMLGRSGFVARVLVEGQVEPGALVEVVD